MRDHITGAVQFVSNNRLKFGGPQEAVTALPDPAETFGHVNKAVPQPAPKDVLAKLDTPEIKERCADLLSRYPVGQGALLEVLWLVQGVFGWVPTEGIRVPEGEFYCGSECANGELGFTIVSDGSGHPYRIKVRPPCLTQFAAFHELVEGGQLADSMAVLSGLNIIAGELDR